MICKLCGKEVSDDALYCDGCGNSLRNSGEQPQAQPERPLTEQSADSRPLAEEPGTGQLTFEQRPRPSDAAPDGASARQEAVPVPAAPPKLRSHMVLSIVTTVLFGNWILGIPAIVFARECELAAEKEQWDIASRFSGKALAFSLIGTAVSIAIWAFVALVVVVIAAASPTLFFW